MTDIAIKVENLSKLYRIGLKEEIHDTLVGAAMDFVRRPVRNIRRLRRLTAFSEGEEEGTVWALKDVSFEVKRGEVVGIIGRNGAGNAVVPEDVPPYAIVGDVSARILGDRRN